MLLNIEKINARFERLAHHILKLRWLYLSLFIATIITCVYGSTLIKIDTSNENSFLESDSIKIQTNHFEEIFGNDQYVIVLLENDDLFTHQSLTLVRELHEELLDSVLFVERILSINDLEFTVGDEYGMVIEQIVPGVIPTDPAELAKIKDKAFSKESFRKRLISTDGTQTLLTIKFLPFPEDWQGEYETSPDELAGKLVLDVINQDKYESLNPRAVGMPIVNHEKREYFAVESSRVMGLAVLLAIIILIIALRSVWGVVIPVISAVCSMIVIYGVVGFIGKPVDNMVLNFPFLIGFAVSIAYSIHLFSFYKQHFRRHGMRKEAITYSFGEVGWAVLFTALTTISALLSALFIPVKTVRFMGLSTAGIVAAAFTIVMVLTPVLLSFGKNKKRHPKYLKNKHSKFESRLYNLGNWILNNPKKIIFSYLLIIGVLIWGVSKITVDTNPKKTIGTKVPYVKNIFELAKTELGSLYSYEVMIELPEAGMAKEPGVLRKLESLETKALESSMAKKSNSILDVVKDMNQVLNNDNPEYYKIPESRELTAQLLLLYENAGGTESEYWVDYDYKYLRLSVHLNDMQVKQMTADFNEVTEYARALFPNSEINIVGTIPQFIKMIGYITKGQIVSFGIAMLVIALLMMLVFGSVKTGLIALIPNLTPALVIGGIMGFAGVPLDSSTVLIMPMILGLAVDDTIHFINHSKLEFLRTRNYRESILRSIRSVGVALVFTTLVLSANFLTYLTSEVKFYFFLGILAVSGMLSALIADFFVTPLLFKRFKIFGEEK
ncbi:MAG: MMPL family transporter [Bacteroidales bacterium]|nr:MMPL family transporter [Bacteroidales bacterium]